VDVTFELRLSPTTDLGKQSIRPGQRDVSPEPSTIPAYRICVPRRTPVLYPVKIDAEEEQSGRFAAYDLLGAGSGPIKSRERPALLPQLPAGHLRGVLSSTDLPACDRAAPVTPSSVQ